MYDNDPIVGSLVFTIQMLLRKVEWRVEPPVASTVEGIAAARQQQRMQMLQQRRQDQLMQQAQLAQGAQGGGAGGMAPGGKPMGPTPPPQPQPHFAAPNDGGAPPAFHEPLQPGQTTAGPLGHPAPHAAGTQPYDHTSGQAPTPPGQPGPNPQSPTTAPGQNLPGTSNSPNTNPGGGPAQAPALGGHDGLPGARPNAPSPTDPGSDTEIGGLTPPVKPRMSGPSPLTKESQELVFKSLAAAIGDVEAGYLLESIGIIDANSTEVFKAGSAGQFSGDIAAVDVGPIPTDPESQEPMDFPVGTDPLAPPSPEELHAMELAVFVETCHPAGTMIRTDSGDLPIEAIELGQLVTTHLGHSLPVTETIAFRYDGGLVTLNRVASYRPIVATEDHLLFAARRPIDWYARSARVRGGRGGAAYHDYSQLEPIWIKASELVKGDFLLEPVPTSPVSPRDDEIIWEFMPKAKGRPPGGFKTIRASKQLCRLIGYYLAEGSHDARSTHFAFHSKETEYHADVLALARDVFGLDGRVQFQDGHRGNVRIPGVAMRHFFEQQVPGTAGKKRVPSWVFDLSDDCITELLIGYFRGDGCVAHDRIVVSSASEGLTEDIRQLLLRLGVVAGLVKPNVSTSKFSKARLPQHTLQVAGGAGSRLAAILGEPWSRNRGRNSAFTHDGYAYYPIVSTETDPVEDHVVYNLEVEKDHSYIAEGIASHNCLHDCADPWADMISQIVTMVVYGFALHELVYKKRNGPNPEAPVQGSRFSDGRIGWAKIAGRAQETRHRWEFDEVGNVLGMWQLAPPKFQLKYIPMAKALLFRTTGYKNNPEGRSLLRSAYRPWYFKRRIEEIEAIGVERDLAGIPKFTVPWEWFGEHATPNQMAALNEVKSIAKNIRIDEQGAIVIPAMFEPDHGQKIFDFELVGASGSSRKNFDTGKIIERYDQRIAMVALIDFILLGHDSAGSKALADTKTDLFTSALEALLDTIADVFNTMAIPRLMQMNGEDPAMSPRITFGKLARISVTEMAALITSLAAAGADLFPDAVLEDSIRDAAGLPGKQASDDL